MSTPAESRAEEIIARERRFRDAQAQSYDAHRGRHEFMRDVERASIVEEIGLEQGHTLLDAGCGTSPDLQDLLERAGHVIGVDHSPKSIEVARERVRPADADRVEFHVADLRSLPVADEAADRAICVEVLQHIPTTEARIEALREMRRVLRPGGRAVIVAYRWRGHIRREKEGYFEGGLYRYAFTAPESRRLMADAGYDEVRIGGTVFAPGPAVRLGMSVAAQCRLVHNPLAMPFAHYILASGVKRA